MRKGHRHVAVGRLPAGGLVTSIALAVVVELYSRSHGVNAIVVFGYLLAGCAFAVTAPMPPDAIAASADDRACVCRAPRTGLRVATVGVLTAVALNVVADLLVYDSLRSDRVSIVGPVLWGSSILLLLAVAIVARPLPTWSSRWTGERLGTRFLDRRALPVALVLIFAAACVARFVALGEVPRGINADEGDRAASAMSLLSGGTSRNLFASGWFYISNVYFWPLAGVMKIAGVGFAQARLLGALCSTLTLAVIVWIALRHFGRRVALLTAVVGASLGVSLQFARETTEATPTALLWALSIALLLEAGRGGGTWPWVGAGVAGALSVYFYPSGRLWFVLAVLVCIHVGIRAGRRKWLAVGAGSLATGLAALLTAGPFLANAHAFPGELTRRAAQTSVFSDGNTRRLPYYNPDWNDLQLLWVQLKHSLAICANSRDAADFWPTGRPILGSVLSVLVFLGLVWFTVSWRCTPKFVVALWFWIGFSGVVLTVETPNLQRMATAVPVLPLFAAAVLDAGAARIAGWGREAAPRVAGMLPLLAAAGATALALGIAVQQGRFYFGTYGEMERWPQPTVQGLAVGAQGRDALAMTVGREFHQVNSGWVRLLAPHVARGGVASPGADLPLPLAPTRDLAFVLYPEQEVYIPLLHSLYPGGSLRRWVHRTEGLVVTVYRVPRGRVASGQGVLAVPLDGTAGPVIDIGDVPAGLRLPARVRWVAELRVPAYWNYAFRLRHGPARLVVDGRRVVAVSGGRAAAAATVALARGRHLVMIEGVARSGEAGPVLEWKARGAGGPVGTPGLKAWRRVASRYLAPIRSRHGLFGMVRGVDGTAEARVDGTLATCCLRDDVGAGTAPYAARWTGMLDAPATGTYGMALFSQGLATLKIDGHVVIRTRTAADATTRARIPLAAGPHAVVMQYRVSGTPGGLEWSWTPPGETETIVPPSALQPPPGAGIGSALPDAELARLSRRPLPLLIVKR